MFFFFFFYIIVNDIKKLINRININNFSAFSKGYKKDKIYKFKRNPKEQKNISPDELF